MNPTGYQVAKAQSAALYDAHRAAGKALTALPGVGSGAMGLTPENVKQSPAYQAAKRAEREAFAALRSFNADYVKTYAKEIRADSRANRA